jgi:hypothetical protein
MKIFIFLFTLFCGVAYAQTNSREFSSAQEAITWAQENKADAIGITHIAITGNNDEADLLKLRTLNNNSGSGLFGSLESIELSAQTGAIPNSCFYAHYSGVQWLKRFSAPSLIGIGNWAFRFCTALSEVELPAVTSIGTAAFYNCSLASIRLPASLENMEANPFLGCKRLKMITIYTGNESFKVEDDVLYNATKTLLITYPAGKTGTSFTSPNTVTTIGSNAFGICAGLTEVTLPAVTSVGNWASEYCTGLKILKFRTSGAINWGADIFSGVTTAAIDLYLNVTGEEYTTNVSGKAWKGYEWKSVNGESSSEIEETGKPFVRIFPNSVRDVLYIDSNEEISGIAVYDLNAKIALQAIYTDSGINLSALPNGVYVVRITTASGILNERIVKTN